MNSKGWEKTTTEGVTLWRPAILAVCLALGFGTAATQLAAQEIDEGGLVMTEQSMWAGLAYLLIAAVLLLVAIWVILRIRIWILGRLNAMATLPGGISGVLATGLKPHILQAGHVLTRVAAVVITGFLIYLWLVYAFKQFSYTASWGDQLGEFLVSLFLNFGQGALRAIPGLVTVVVIILIARWGVRLINTVFKEVETGTLSVPWLERETARTTQTLLIVVVWLFALVVAYPYIPGSETEAFKGLSVLIGLMVTLGSTGLINQIISGLFVIYSRSVRPGDYVRIGEVEGEVIDVGFLATKLKTPRQEEITLPHSVLVGNATTNYSRLAGDNGMVVTTSVTIGYDAPWRQIHALLLLGASRTPGIRKEPPPRVLQRELADFYIQYLLLAHLEDPKSRAVVLSELHGQIQDAFNEYGTQIMSPHFVSQPDRPVFVPKTDWYAAPASANVLSGGAVGVDETGNKGSSGKPQP